MRIKKEIISFSKSLIIAIGIAFGITLVIQPTIVNGYSMYPTLDDKDYLFINKLAYKIEEPKMGDIIVFETVDGNDVKNLVKRVIAVPGEHIVIEDGNVYVDGEMLAEDYINSESTSGNVDMLVPQNHVFTMGDNRGRSKDSRSSDVGTISIDKVAGKVSLRAFPFKRLGKVE